MHSGHSQLVRMTLLQAAALQCLLHTPGAFKNYFLLPPDTKNRDLKTLPNQTQPILELAQGYFRDINEVGIHGM